MGEAAPRRLAKQPKTPVLFESLNVPTCTTGKVRGARGDDRRDHRGNALIEANCASTLTNPTDDIQAFNSGYASLTKPWVAPATTG